VAGLMPVFFLNMSRYHSYLASATHIIQAYHGGEPFVYFIKKQFAVHKKFGSRDRKIISSLCYSYFRTYSLFKDETTEQHILKGLFLCESKSHDLLEALSAELHEKVTLSAEEKIEFLGLLPRSLFPFLDDLGPVIHPLEFSLSILRQPLLYLRLRPGKKNGVLAKLHEAGLSYDLLKDDCIVLKNATAVDTLLRLNKEAVVQDYNSQRVFDFPENLVQLSSKERKLTVWDCCAASGGKSILLYDTLQGNIQLTVSDIRKNILHNLQQRLQEAIVPVYKTFAADLAQGVPEENTDFFDIIICDAPCTGSGTWSRTPEQLAFFKAGSIDEFSSKQKKIAGNASALLKKEGLFYYITCSVFKKENEDIVGFLQKEKGLTLLHQEYLEGYQMQADTLFVAVFKK
jgi:16S rRNA (cytosine967-C5)-methyltransferase